MTNLQDTRGIRQQIASCTLGTGYVAGFPGTADVAFCTLVAPGFNPAPALFSAVAPPTPALYTKIAVTSITTALPVFANSTVCKVAGWGSLSMVNLGTGYYSNALQELTVSILDTTACGRMWPK